MKKLYFFLAILNTALFHFPSAAAYTGICTPTGGTHIFNYDSSYDLKEVSNNSAGTIIDNIFNYSIGGSYTATCDNGGTYSADYIDTNSDLPVYEVADNVTWYKINDYIAMSSQGYVAGNVNKYFNVPFIESNQCNQAKCPPSAPYSSGSQGTVSLLIIKPFVGIAPFNSVLNYTKISTNKDTVESGPYMSEVIISGYISSPQSCELNAGQVISMDFGNIGASSFSDAGAGNRPAGVNPQTRSIGIKCKNMDAQAMLSMRIEATNVSGNAIISDNPDLGFVIGNSSHEPLTPNNINSKIPFQLDDNAAATVPISAWPVSVTGNTPAEGKFTSEGYLRVDFD
ncbi:fimbrial protein [Erwinia amylovora]